MTETLRAELEIRLRQEREHGTDPDRIAALELQLAELGPEAPSEADLDAAKTDPADETEVDHTTEYNSTADPAEGDAI